MLRNWPILFIVIPLIELYVIIAVGEEIGAFWTVILVLMTAFIGVNLLRMQGMSTLMRAQNSMSQGQVPAMEMMEGIAIAVAGVLLITPGFITDTLGFLCLIPATRQALIRYIMAKSTVHTTFNAGSDGFQPGQHHGHQQDGQQKKSGRTIEGECRRED